MLLLLVYPAFAMEPADAEKALASFAGQDHFAADAHGLYTGVNDPLVRASLNGAVDSAAAALASARAAGASDGEVLAVFQKSLVLVDREALDTEDAERVATVFEELLEASGLESSGGALNQWMYGFDPLQFKSAEP
ncbi:DUF4844 domain-containing protein [Lysobacter sp. HA18]